MPKRNATESSTTNFQDNVLVNQSNSNLNSRMVDASGESRSKKKILGEDECDAIGDLIGHYGKWQFVMTILLSLFQVPNTFHIVSPSFQVICLHNLPHALRRQFSALHDEALIRLMWSLISVTRVVDLFLNADLCGFVQTKQTSSEWFSFKAADKDFWCERPKHLLNNITSIDAWRAVSNSSDNCHIYDYDWDILSSHQINVNTKKNPSLIALIVWLTICFSLLFPSKENYSISNTSKMIKCDKWEYNMTDGLGNTWNSEWDLVCDKKYLKIVAEMVFLIGVATGGM